MKCPTCHCHIDPKLDWRSLLAIIALTLLVGFVGTIFFYNWKMTPKFERQIEKDREIKKELEKNYVPTLPKKKG
jgi:hypothetical protein